MRRIVRRTVTTVTTITTTITWQETADESSDVADGSEPPHDSESTAESDSKQADSFGQIVN